MGDSIFTGNGKPPVYYHGDVDVDELVRKRSEEIQKNVRPDEIFTPPVYHGYNSSKGLDIQEMVEKIDKNDVLEVAKKYRKNSVGTKFPVRMSDKKKVQSNNKAEDNKKRIVAIAVAVGIAVGVFGSNFVRNNRDFSDAYKYIHQYQYIVNENVHNNMSGRLDDYWYDTDQMGKEVVKSDDPQLALYEVYSGLHYQPISSTSEVFTFAKTYARENGIDTFDFNDCETFDDYVRSLGCVDKNGETDFKAYENSMEQLALAKVIANDATKNATTISNEDKTGKGGK